MSKKYLIKIPNYIHLIYHVQKKLLLLIGPLWVKTLKLNLQLFIHKSKSIIKVSSVQFFKISNKSKKKKKFIKV